MTNPSPVISPSLVDRAKNILLNPKTEWDVIRSEPATVQSLFTGYACILALIPAVCGLLAVVLWGGLFGGFVVGGLLIGAVVGAILGYVLGLLGVFLLGLIIEALAPNFGAEKNRVQAMKVAVYSTTAAWVGGVFSLIPGLGWVLALLAGLYGIYLLYLGLKQVLGTPEDKAIVFTIVAVVIYVVIAVIIGTIISGITAAIMLGGIGAAGMAGAAAYS